MERNNSQVSAEIPADTESLSTGREKAMREGTNYSSAVSAEERHGDKKFPVDFWRRQSPKMCTQQPFKSLRSAIFCKNEIY